MYHLKLQTHRGVMTEAPENTLSAYRAAIKQGYEIIEVDTKFTKDNRCVLLHDDTVNRTGRNPDGSQLTEKTHISELTLDEVRKLDFGLSFSEEFRGEKIPTLEEVLELAVKTGACFKFDNVLQTHTSEQQDIFFDTVERMHALTNVQLGAYSLDFLGCIRERFPNATVYYDGPVDDEVLAQLPKYGPKERLWVWIQLGTPETAWCKNPPITEELAEKVHEFANLGLWRAMNMDDIKLIKDTYHADAAETDGRLKPSMV